MSEAQAPMPRYLCRKIVHALKITGVELRNNGEALLQPEDGQFKPLLVTAAWMEAHMPAAFFGGYFVQYRDGYTSYSPQKPFEEGYTRIDGSPPFSDLRLHRRIGNDRQPYVNTLDQPEPPSNAHHQYLITPPHSERKPTPPTLIEFLTLEQEGITNEALLAIVAHRLQCFQKSQFACRENALALTKIEEALHWLESRTLDRSARGVEGTHTP